MDFNFAAKNKAGVSKNVYSTLLEPERKETISQTKASWSPRPDRNYHHNALPRPAGGNRESPFHHLRQTTQAWMLGTRGVLEVFSWRDSNVSGSRNWPRKGWKGSMWGRGKDASKNVENEIGLCDPYTHLR